MAKDTAKDPVTVTPFTAYETPAVIDAPSLASIEAASNKVPTPTPTPTPAPTSSKKSKVEAYVKAEPVVEEVVAETPIEETETNPVEGVQE